MGPVEERHRCPHTWPNVPAHALLYADMRHTGSSGTGPHAARTYGYIGPSPALGSAGTMLFQRVDLAAVVPLERLSTFRPCQVPVTRAVAGPPWIIVQTASEGTGLNASLPPEVARSSAAHARAASRPGRSPPEGRQRTVYEPSCAALPLPVTVKASRSPALGAPGVTWDPSALRPDTVTGRRADGGGGTRGAHEGEEGGGGGCDGENGDGTAWHVCSKWSRGAGHVADRERARAVRERCPCGCWAAPD